MGFEQIDERLESHEEAARIDAELDARDTRGRRRVELLAYASIGAFLVLTGWLFWKSLSWGYVGGLLTGLVAGTVVGFMIGALIATGANSAGKLKGRGR